MIEAETVLVLLYLFGHVHAASQMICIKRMCSRSSNLDSKLLADNMHLLNGSNSCAIRLVECSLSHTYFSCCWCLRAGKAHQAAPAHPYAGAVVSEEDLDGAAGNSSGV